MRERDHLEDLGIDGKIILKWLFEKWDGEHGLDWSGSQKGQVAGYCECGYEPLSFIECEKILD